MADEQDARVLLAEALFSDPKARPVMEDLIAEKFPKAAPTIPGFQARKAVEAELAELRKLRDDLKSDREAEKTRREIDAEWAKAAQVYSLADEDRKEVEEWMGKNATANYLIAARDITEARRAAIAPPRSDARTMQVPGVKGAGGDWFKGIVENPEEWGRNAAEQVVQDIQRGQLSKHL